MKKCDRPMSVGIIGAKPNARSPEVELCGYSIPHPSEAKMNIRIQTYGAVSGYYSSVCMDLTDTISQMAQQSMMY